MKERMISAFFGILLLLVVIFSEKMVLGIAVLLITWIAMLEVFAATGLIRHRPMIVISMLMPIFVELGFLQNNNRLTLAIYLYLVLLFVCLLINHKEHSFADLATTFAVTLWISLFFSHLVGTRQMDHGLMLLWLVFIGAWGTDSLAYFCGRAFGKHKLAPIVSPKKTIEGAIGGAVGCAVVMLLYGLILSHFYSMHVEWVALGILGLLCGVVSQLGDLSASLVKRQYGIKDFGHIMPGHGGVMDRFDSISFVAPLVFYFVQQFPILS